MNRRDLNKTAVFALFVGLLLRAVTPLGYMPGTSGDGLLFELCPEQLPPGFEMPGAATSHHHHGVNGGSSADAESDLCQIGHLLFSAISFDQIDLEINSEPKLDGYLSYSAQIVRLSLVTGFRPRAPPA